MREIVTLTRRSFVFVTKRRVSVTSVTASFGHSAATAGDIVSRFGCGVGRAVTVAAVVLAAAPVAGAVDAQEVCVIRVEGMR